MGLCRSIPVSHMCSMLGCFVMLAKILANYCWCTETSDVVHMFCSYTSRPGVVFHFFSFALWPFVFLLLDSSSPHQVMIHQGDSALRYEKLGYFTSPLSGIFLQLRSNGFSDFLAWSEHTLLFRIEATTSHLRQLEGFIALA